MSLMRRQPRGASSTALGSTVHQGRQECNRLWYEALRLLRKPYGKCSYQDAHRSVVPASDFAMRKVLAKQNRHGCEHRVPAAHRVVKTESDTSLQR